MQEIRLIGFLFENRLHWPFKAENPPKNGCFRLHMDLRTNTTLIRNSLYVFEKWGKI